MKNLKLIRNITWGEIFANWQANEGSRLSWQEFAQQEKGWESWEAWRRYMSDQYDASHRTWKLYEITDPAEAIPDFKLGPYKGWQQHFEDKLEHSFKDLATTQEVWMRKNTGIQNCLAHFPVNGTQFFGAHISDDDSVILLEGHHRCAAFSLAAHDGHPIIFNQSPLIALTEITPDYIEEFKKMLTVGSHKSTASPESPQ